MLDEIDERFISPLGNRGALAEFSELNYSPES
jgi:hypothetical protein